MNNEQFIEQIASYVIKYAPSYNIAVHSPIIAQSILESSFGTSELAINACNYFGLKWRDGRCPTATGIYSKTGSEQNSDGSYIYSDMQWCKFPNMETGVQGYFDFINIPNYSNLKRVTNPQIYLEYIKSDGYATSLDYVSNLMDVIKKYNLTQYDDVDGGKNMSNSSLVSYTKLSPNHSGKRTMGIDRISPHCVVGQLSVETLGSIFAPTTKQASCNYAIGSDGRVALIVDEGNRSWCTSSNANDQRAVTIECASDTTSPYAFNMTVYNKLVDLCVDICQRNGKKKLLWISDKNAALAYTPASNEMLLTVHRWFAAKSCPGDWLMARMNDLVNQVNQKLGASSATVSTSTSSTTTTSTAKPILSDTVKVIVDELNIRKEPGTHSSIVGVIHQGEVYTIVEYKDGWGKLKSGIGWINCSSKYVQKVNTGTASSTISQNNTSVSNPPKATTVNNTILSVYYKVYTTKWLGEIENYNESTTNGYAGIENVAMTGIMAKIPRGKIRTRVRLKGKQNYLSWIDGYSTKDDKNGYAGVLGKPIDRIQFELSGAPGYDVEYRVSVVGNQVYLPWVRGTQDYAGIDGKSIDKLQIRIIKK